MTWQKIKSLSNYQELSKEERNSIFKEENDRYFESVIGGNKSQQARLDQLLKNSVQNITAKISGSLVQQYSNKLQKSAFNAILGKERMISFRDNIPIPIDISQIYFFTHEKSFYAKYTVEGKGKKNKSILFKVVAGKNFNMSDGPKNLNNLISTKNKVNGKEVFGYTSGNLQFRKVRGKIKLFFSYVVDEEPKTENSFIEGRVVGVDIGMKIPAYVSLNTTGWSKALGNDHLLKKKLRFKAQRRKLQEGLSMNKGGHGYIQKMKKLEQFKDYENNFTKNYTFSIAKNIVKFAVRNKAPQINLELLEGITKDQEKARYFPYYMLQNRIEQLADKEGIKVRYIDPYHTSQNCSCCGEKGERSKQASFKCINPECENNDKVVNADRNASLNIANSIKYVTTKSQCEYFKKK